MVKKKEVKRQPTVGKKQHKKIKTEQNVGCSGVVSRSCPTCGILRVAYFRKKHGNKPNSVGDILGEKNEIVVTTFGTNLLTSVKHILHNDQSTRERHL